MAVKYLFTFESLYLVSERLFCCWVDFVEICREMGQELSLQESQSILEPLSVSVTESPVSCAQRRAQIEEEQMDPDLVRSIIALTEQSSEASSPMYSDKRSDDVELNKMRAEAEKDYQEWKAARKLMRRLERHGSSTSTLSSPGSLNRANHIFTINN
jgi:hypothetical protein